MEDEYKIICGTEATPYPPVCEELAISYLEACLLFCELAEIYEDRKIQEVLLEMGEVSMLSATEALFDLSNALLSCGFGAINESMEQFCELGYGEPIRKPDKLPRPSRKLPIPPKKYTMKIRPCARSKC